MTGPSSPADERLDRRRFLRLAGAAALAGPVAAALSACEEAADAGAAVRPVAGARGPRRRGRPADRARRGAARLPVEGVPVGGRARGFRTRPRGARPPRRGGELRTHRRGGGPDAGARRGLRRRLPHRRRPPRARGRAAPATAVARPAPAPREPLGVVHGGRRPLLRPRPALHHPVHRLLGRDRVAGRPRTAGRRARPPRRPHRGLRGRPLPRPRRVLRQLPGRARARAPARGGHGPRVRRATATWPPRARSSTTPSARRTRGSRSTACRRG